MVVSVIRSEFNLTETKSELLCYFSLSLCRAVLTELEDVTHRL